MLFSSLLLLTIIIPNSEGITFLRTRNERGPIAWNAGVNCLETVTKMYFDASRTGNRVRNMLVTHSWNMTNPAAEIESLYLKSKNTYYPPGKNNPTMYQLRIISDNFPVSELMQVPFNAITIADYYVIVIDSVTSFKNLLENYVSQSPSWNPAGKILMLYNNVSDRNRSHELAEDIFEIFKYKYNAANVVLLVAKNITEYDVFVSSSFDQSSCGKARAKFLSSCDNGYIQNAIITELELKYAQIPKSLANCTFTLCSRVALPYIEKLCSEGLELKILSVIQQKLGFKYNNNCEYITRGILLANLTWTSLLADIQSGLCDFALGGFFPDNEVHDYFAVTESYLADSYTWYVNVAPPKARWKGLISIFNFETWICFVIVLFISGITWAFVGRISPEDSFHTILSMTVLNSWGVTLGASVNNRPLYLPLRVFFVALALYALNVTSIYTSKLIAIFANPGYEHQISTFSEIIKNKIPYGGRAEYQDWFENEDDIYIFNGYNSSEYFLPQDRVLKRVIEGKQALLMNRMYILRKQQRDDLYEFKDDVFSSSLEMIARRGFPLLSKFNFILRSLEDSGILYKFVNDFVYNMTILMKISKWRPTFQESEIILTLDHLQGAFAVILIGLSLSSFVFLLEIISFLDLNFIWNAFLKIKTSLSKKMIKRNYVHTELKTYD